ERRAPDAVRFQSHRVRGNRRRGTCARRKRTGPLLARGTRARRNRPGHRRLRPGPAGLKRTPSRYFAASEVIMPTRLVELHEDPRTELLTLQNVDTPPAPRAKRVIGLAVVLGVLAVIAIAEYAVLTTAAVVPNLLFLFGPGLVAAVVLLCRSRRLLSLRVSRPDAELAFVQGVPGESSNSTTLSCATVGS